MGGALSEKKKKKLQGRAVLDMPVPKGRSDDKEKKKNWELRKG